MAKKDDLNPKPQEIKTSTTDAQKGGGDVGGGGTAEPVTKAAADEGTGGDGESQNQDAQSADAESQDSEESQEEQPVHEEVVEYGGQRIIIEMQTSKQTGEDHGLCRYRFSNNDGEFSQTLRVPDKYLKAKSNVTEARQLLTLAAKADVDRYNKQSGRNEKGERV